MPDAAGSGHAGGGGNEAHRHVITAVELEGGPHLLAIIAAEPVSIFTLPGFAGARSIAPWVPGRPTLTPDAKDDRQGECLITRLMA